MAKKGPVGRIVNKLLTTESEWNPKVAVGRLVVRVLPDSWLFALKKAYYPRVLARDGSLPEADAAIVRHLVSAGDQVIDVGASIGQYTKFLADLVGPSGRVYSFEPLPPTFEILSCCVRKLGLHNAKLFNYAVSDTDGSTVMVVPLYRWGTECYYDARIATAAEKQGLREFQVTKRAIDSIFNENNEKVCFIKSDVNYHELSFVRGSLNTIHRFKPALLVEVGTNPDASVAETILAMLREQEYDAYHFDGSKLHARTPGVRNQNWFFLRPDHIAALRERCPQLLAI